MAIDVQTVLEGLLTTPKSMTTDAGTIVQRSADEMATLLELIAIQKSKRRPAMFITRGIMPGMVGPRSRGQLPE